jgi:hypothetical protein
MGLTQRINKKVAEGVEAVLGAMASLNRGDIITHEDIASASGIPYMGEGWGLLITKVKRRFEETRGITLWAVVEVGYKLGTAEEQLNAFPARRARRAIRQLNRGLSHMESIPTEDLSAHQQSIRATKIDGQRKAMKKVRQMQRFANALSPEAPSNG